MLDPRAQTLLKTLIERYIAEGQPVGSRTLSRFSGLELSPATIRNVMSDLEELDPIIEEILAASPGQVAAFRNGKDGLLGFFVGQVMKATGGQANPRIVSERVREKLLA